MNKPSFVYVTYIAATQENVFSALIDPELTRRYWGNHRNASDWRVGSAWRHEDYDDPNDLDIVGTVLESDPPRRLVVSWADPDHAHDPAHVSRVTYALEPFEGSVKLTVTHDDLQPDSGMQRGVSFGWPLVLSNLKSILETGTTLPHWDQFFTERAAARA